MCVCVGGGGGVGRGGGPEVVEPVIHFLFFVVGRFGLAVRR